MRRDLPIDGLPINGLVINRLVINSDAREVLMGDLRDVGGARCQRASSARPQKAGGFKEALSIQHAESIREKTLRQIENRQRRAASDPAAS